MQIWEETCIHIHKSTYTQRRKARQIYIKCYIRLKKILRAALYFSNFHVILQINWHISLLHGRESYFKILLRFGICVNPHDQKQRVQVFINHASADISWWITIMQFRPERKYLLKFTQHGWTDGTERALKWQILGVGHTSRLPGISLLTLSHQRTHLSCFRRTYSILTSKSISTISLAQLPFWWAIFSWWRF